MSLPEEVHVAPHRKSSRRHVTWLMITDIVGTSVLTLAGVAAQLGWLPFLILLATCCPVAIYTACLMSRTRGLLAALKGVEPLSMGHAARLTMGARASTIVFAAVYTFAFLGQGSYLLIMGQALQGVFYTSGACLPTCVLASCFCVWPITACMRQISDSVLLCFANFFIILAVVGIVMAKLASDGRANGVESPLVADGLTPLSLLGGATNIVYSYAGHWLYFEIMAEMTRPEQFPRVFVFNGPLQVSLYALVASWGYYYAGKGAKGYFLDNLQPGPEYQWASGLLFAHVAITLLLKNVVLARFLHSCLSPSRSGVLLGQPGGVRAHLEFVACGTFMLAGGFLVANLVPFFDALLGLIGGLLSAPISFFLPMLLFAQASRAADAAGLGARMEQGVGMEQARQEGSARAPFSPLEVLEAEGAEPFVVTGRSLSDPRIVLKEASDRLSTWDVVLFIVIGSFALATMVLGTYDQISTIVGRTSTYGPPFACKALAV